MCGIAGYLTNDAPPDRMLLKRMCDRLIHRGPDAYGQFCDSRIALGHRRLSIIDLAGGNQPLGNEDGTIQVVFNGEIYNFQELRQDLLKKGHRFRTRSDTEVLVHLYEDVGDRLPEFLNGMFAFAIWDTRRRELFLARDRFGKKPLYYSFSVPGMSCCFASELKALTLLPGFPDQVNERALADFLCLSYVPDPDTIYKNVFKLAPAHTLTVNESGHRLRRYWEPVFDPDPDLNFDATVGEIRALAADAVKRRMISDVPLGAFLSGGVDSSAVVAFMAEQAPDRVKTFTIGFTNKDYDETRYARLVADRYHTDHHEQIVNPIPVGQVPDLPRFELEQAAAPSFQEILATLAEHYDEPFGDASAIPTLYLARMTRQYVTVALSGDGADEVFGGYRRYRFGVLEERIRQKFPQLFRQTFFKAAGRLYPKFDYLPQVFRAKTLLTNLSQEIGDAYFTSMTAFRDECLDKILSPDIRKALDGYSPRESFRDRFRAVCHLPPLQQMQAVDFQTYLPGDILVKADRATMAYSLETRSPWLDYRLAELAGRLPASFKVNGAAGKHIFKKAIASRVPEQLINRTKMGFSVPLAQWFRSSLKPAFESTVMRDGMHQLLSPQSVQRLWDEHQSGISDHSRKFWNLLMLATWDGSHNNHPGQAPLAETISLPS
jgi:asparagine synthase (glutamine-hydrolysing)